MYIEIHSQVNDPNKIRIIDNANFSQKSVDLWISCIILSVQEVFIFIKETANVKMEILYL